MKRRYWALAIWLWAFFRLLWAKLPGPSSIGGGFRFARKEKEEKEWLEVFHNDGKVDQFLSDRITGITVQKVKSLASGEYVTDGELLRSDVEVKIPESSIAELRGLNNPDMENVLLSGSGQIAIVTGIVNVEERRLEYAKEFLGKGTGRGTWEIQPMSKE